MTPHNYSGPGEEWFEELNDYLHGALHVEEHFDDHEEYVESLDDEAYLLYMEQTEEAEEDVSGQKQDWPIHPDFFGHVVDDELSTFEDQSQPGRVA